MISKGAKRSTYKRNNNIEKQKRTGSAQDGADRRGEFALKCNHPLAAARNQPIIHPFHIHRINLAPF